MYSSINNAWYGQKVYIERSGLMARWEKWNSTLEMSSMMQFAFCYFLDTVILAVRGRTWTTHQQTCLFLNMKASQCHLHCRGQKTMAPLFLPLHLNQRTYSNSQIHSWLLIFDPISLFSMGTYHFKESFVIKYLSLWTSKIY